MVKLLAFCILFAQGLTAYCQYCDCSAELSFVRNYYEKNNPAFQKIKTNVSALRSYKQSLQSIVLAAKKNTDPDKCIIYLDRYVALLKDHHSQIGYNLVRKDLNTQQQLDSFLNSAAYKSFPKFRIDIATLVPQLKNKNPISVEGLYTNGGSIYFGITRSKDDSSKYYGVVVKKTKLLDVGHILLELTSIGQDQYYCTYNIGLLGFNFHRIYKTLTIKNGQITELGFSKTGNNLLETKSYEFRSLSRQTNYIRLSSFDASLTVVLDSFYASIEKDIKGKPNLVIDLRNNSGGSEESFYNLLPLLYTKPFVLDSVRVWVSPENINRYEEAGMDSLLISRMKKAKPYTYIPQMANASSTWVLDSITKTPSNIAVLFNRGTASSAEGMIMYCMQSSKVITMGENSGGYVGYGDVMTFVTPCGKYKILSTTTQYEQKSRFEFVGISPMIRLFPGQDWIKAASDQLESRGKLD